MQGPGHSAFWLDLLSPRLTLWILPGTSGTYENPWVLSRPTLFCPDPLHEADFLGAVGASATIEIGSLGVADPEILNPNSTEELTALPQMDLRDRLTAGKGSETGGKGV